MTNTEEESRDSLTITVDNGKYTFRINADYKVVCDRGPIKDWVVFDEGTKALMSLLYRVDELEKENVRLKEEIDSIHLTNRVNDGRRRI